LERRQRDLLAPEELELLRSMLESRLPPPVPGAESNSDAVAGDATANEPDERFGRHVFSSPPFDDSEAWAEQLQREAEELEKRLREHEQDCASPQQGLRTDGASSALSEEGHRMAQTGMWLEHKLQTVQRHREQLQEVLGGGMLNYDEFQRVLAALAHPSSKLESAAELVRIAASAAEAERGAPDEAPAQKELASAKAALMKLHSETQLHDKLLPFFQASTFLKFARDSYGRISSRALFRYVRSTMELQRTRVVLSLYDRDGRGYLRESDLVRARSPWPLTHLLASP